MKICAHTLVRDEEKYLWFSVTSVIDYIDKLMLWDTGSTDSTPKIIQELKKKYADKIEMKMWGKVTSEGYTSLRVKMLEETKSDWFIIVDGDEIWWDDGIKTLVQTIRDRPNLDSVVNGYYNCVGDIYHYQAESTGKYKIDNEKGFVTIRAMNRNIPGLYCSKPHGQFGYFDKNNILVQEMAKEKRYHLNQKTYMHFTHLIRSSSHLVDLGVPKRGNKLKYEIGQPFPLDFYYPEVFFKSRPAFISSPWSNSNSEYKLTARAIAVPKFLKRRLVKSKSGY